MAGRPLSRVEDLFLCATEPPGRALQRWTSFLQGCPLDDVQGPEFRLLPAVWKNLSNQSQPIPEAGRLKGLYRYSWVRNIRLKRACELTVDYLQERGMQVVVIKGLAINEAIYQDNGTRPAEDFDLLVPFPRAREALELLFADGWTLIEDWLPPEPELRVDHAVGLEKDGLHLDLHWFSARECRDPDSDALLWSRAIPLKVGAVSTLAPAPADQLFLLLMSASREPHQTHRYLLDIHNLRKVSPDELAIPELHRRLREARVSHRLTYLPLKELGWTELVPGNPAGLLDRLWSFSSRNLISGPEEWVTGLFPLVDYCRHYLFSSRREVGIFPYLQRRLRVRSVGDFLSRTYHKLRRTLF